MKESEFPEDMRPDRSGVIVLLGRKWRDWNVVMAIPAGQAVPAESLEWLRVHTQNLKLPLVFHVRIMQEGEFSGSRAQRGEGARIWTAGIRRCGQIRHRSGRRHQDVSPGGHCEPRSATR